MKIFTYYHNKHPKKDQPLLTRWHLVLRDIEYFLPKDKRRKHQQQHQTIETILHRAQQIRQYRYGFQLLYELLCLFDFLEACKQSVTQGIRNTGKILSIGHPTAYLFCALLIPSCSDMYALARTRPVIESIPGDQWPLDYYQHGDFHLAAAVCCFLLTAYLTSQSTIKHWLPRLFTWLTLWWVTSLLGYGVHHFIGATYEPKAMHQCEYFEFMGVW